MRASKLKLIAIALALIMGLTPAACDNAPAIRNSLEPVQETPTPVPEAVPDDPTPEPTEPPTEQEQEPEPPPEPTDTVDGGLPKGQFPFEFSVEDIYGNTVTEASMGEKELFFIHYWGTWCPPCIAEKPDLSKLVADFQDRVGFLNLLDDFENASGAIEIYTHFGFPDTEALITVCARTTFDNQHPVLQWINTGAVPTTVIIDAEGNKLEQLIGARFDGYTEILNGLLAGGN